MCFLYVYFYVFFIVKRQKLEESDVGEMVEKSEVGEVVACGE